MPSGAKMLMADVRRITSAEAADMATAKAVYATVTKAAAHVTATEPATHVAAAEAAAHMAATATATAACLCTGDEKAAG